MTLPTRHHSDRNLGVDPSIRGPTDSGCWVIRGCTTGDSHTWPVVSTVRACVASPVLPATSVTETTTVFVPVSSFAGATLQVPPVRTVTLSVYPPIVTVTSVPTPASVDPLIVGVVSFVAALAPPLIVTINALGVIAVDAMDAGEVPMLLVAVTVNV